MIVGLFGSGVIGTRRDLRVGVVKLGDIPVTVEVAFRFLCPPRREIKLELTCFNALVASTDMM